MNSCNLLKSDEVANRLGVCLSMAYRLLRSGQIPVVRFGRSVRCREQDLDAFILQSLQNEYSSANTRNASVIRPN